MKATKNQEKPQKLQRKITTKTKFENINISLASSRQQLVSKSKVKNFTVNKKESSRDTFINTFSQNYNNSYLLENKRSIYYLSSATSKQ